LRLRDIKLKLAKANEIISNLEITEESARIDNRVEPRVRIKGHMEAIDALLGLEDIPIFVDDIKQIKDMPLIFSVRIPSIVLDQPNGRAVADLFKRVRFKCSTGIELIDYAAPPHDEFTISAKLPPISTFGDISKYASALSIGFNNVIAHECVGGKTQVKGFDSGSEWIDFLVGASQASIQTAIILKFAGELISACLSYTKEAVAIKRLWEEQKRITLSNKILEIQADQLNKLYEIQLKSLEDKYVERLKVHEAVKTPNADFDNALRFAIDSIHNLLLKGGEFRQTVPLSDSNRSPLPAPKEYEMLQNEISLLEPPGRQDPTSASTVVQTEDGG